MAAEALHEFPDDPELLQWQSLAGQGVKRSAESNALLKEGRDLCAARNCQDGLEFLRKAERLEPRNYAARLWARTAQLLRSCFTLSVGREA